MRKNSHCESSFLRNKNVKKYREGIVIGGLLTIISVAANITTLKPYYDCIFEHKQATSIVLKQATPVKESSKDGRNDIFLTLASYMEIYYHKTMSNLEINETLELFNGKKVVWQGLVKYINMSKGVLDEESYIIGFYPENSKKPTYQLHFPVCELPESFKDIVRTLKIGQKIECTGTIISRLRLLATDIKILE